MVKPGFRGAALSTPRPSKRRSQRCRPFGGLWGGLVLGLAGRLVDGQTWSNPQAGVSAVPIRLEAGC